MVLVPKDNMINRYIVQKGSKLGVLVSVDGDGIFTDTTGTRGSKGVVHTFTADGYYHFAEKII